MVRNPYRKSYICIAFALASSLSLLAQSDRNDIQRRDNLELQGDSTQSLLTANLVETTPMGSMGDESELPDAPSATKSDSSTAEPAPAPVVKRAASQGAPPAAKGGPLWVDRSVTDRRYLMITSGIFAASVANAELTLRCLDKHPSCNDVPPSLRSRAALYGIGIPADFAFTYLTYTMKRKHSSLWYLPAAGVTAANVFLAVRAYRWTQQ